MNVVLVEKSDIELAELLRGLGAHVDTCAADDLANAAANVRRSPDALFIDMRGAASLPSALGTFKRRHPDAGVVLIAGALDPALLLEAMRAGVTEVVTAPFDQSDLERALGRAVVDREPVELGRVYGFIGAKGGVGTTTIAVNVATSLGATSKPTRSLLIDLHPAGGDAALFAGAEPRFSVTDALENISRLDRSYFKNLVVPSGPHTDLLAAPDRPRAGAFDRQNVQQLIDFAATAYKHTVLDLARSDGVILESLDQLTAIYIVANQELPTVRSASRLAASLRERYGRDKVTVILSRSDRQADIGHSDVEKAVGSNVAHTFPSDYRVALQAINKGRPLALDNHNDLSASFKKFANSLAGVRPEREQPVRNGGLFSRLKRS